MFPELFSVGLLAMLRVILRSFVSLLPPFFLDSSGEIS